MEITGRIVEVLEEQSGQSAKGGWRKQQYILETQGQFPKKICFMVWGDKIDDFKIKENQEVEVSIDIESREFNGRWYTDVKAWKVVTSGGPAGDSAPPPSEPPPFAEEEDGLEDLPF
jgi:hypothetical protein